MDADVPCVKLGIDPKAARNLATAPFSAKASPPMSETQRPGILPCQSIEALIAGGAIASATPWEADQVQPASRRQKSCHTAILH